MSDTTGGHPRYPNLFSELRLGPKVAKNRIWLTAHGTQLVRDHNFSERHIAYYEERAAGGAGVITMEAMAVHPSTQPYEGKIFAFDERIVPNYRALKAAVSQHECLLLGQLWHRGRQTDSLVSRLPVWSSSPIPDPLYREMPHEMDASDIAALIDGYERSAELAVEGDLDGIEIHGSAHGYLLGQFLSPATNHRDDDYGGSIENRLRLVLEIIDRVRAVVPADRILGVRINGDDGPVEQGLRPSDWAEIAQVIADTGSIDYISVSQGTYAHRMMIYGAAPVRPGYQVEATATVKAAVPDMPVVVVGRITTPELAESVLAQGHADMVGMTRTLIADPQWPEKAHELRDHDIRPCVGANWCMSSIVKAPLACVHNPAVGREAELGIGTLSPSSDTRRVAVVGGGPGGLRAALVAAQRGHQVTLFERESHLGGQVRWLANVGAYREYSGVVDWLEDQVKRAGVAIRLNETVTASQIVAGPFDAAIVATGSAPLRTGWSALHPHRWGGEGLPGVDQWNVFTVEDVLARRAEIPRSVLVFDDIGGRQAAAVAEYLADEGHPVEVATRLGSVFPDLAGSRDIGATHSRLRRLGVVFTRDRDLVSIEEDRVTLRDVHTNETEVRDGVDAVVLVTGNAARTELLTELKDSELSVIAVGDCVAPRRIFNAIWEGERAGRNI